MKRILHPSFGPTALLVAVLGVLYLWNLSRVELSVTDETRSGMIVRDILDGHCLVPRTPDGFLAEKPIMYYGACALLGSVFGVNEWTLRGVSVAAALGTLALSAWITRLYGSPRAMALTVVGLGSNLIFLSSARDARVDMTLTFFLTAGFAAYLAARMGRLAVRKASALCGLAFGAALLTKGPLGLALPMAVIAGDLLLEARGRVWSIHPRWTAGAAAVLLALTVAALWYVPALLRGGSEFLETALISENFRMPAGHAAGIGVSHHKPFHYYFGRQLMGVLSIFPLLGTLPAWYRDPASGVARRHLTAWILFGLLLFQAASNKRFYYLVVLQPPVAVMLGLAADRATLRSEGRKAGGIAGLLVLMAGAVLLGAALQPSLLEPLLTGTVVAALSRHTASLAALSLATMGAGGFLAAASLSGSRLSLHAVASLALLVVAARTGIGDRLAAEFDGSRPFVNAMVSKLPPGAQPIILPPIRGYAIDFYWPRRLRRDEQAALTAEYVLVGRPRLGDLANIRETLGIRGFGDADRDVLLVRRGP